MKGTRNSHWASVQDQKKRDTWFIKRSLNTHTGILIWLLFRQNIFPQKWLLAAAPNNQSQWGIAPAVALSTTSSCFLCSDRNVGYVDLSDGGADSLRSKLTQAIVLRSNGTTLYLTR